MSEVKKAAAEVMEEQKEILERLTDEPKPQVEFTPEQQEYMAFVSKHKDRCMMWAKVNGDVTFPIVRQPDGSFVWLNRDQRRNLIKRHKNQK